MNLEEQLRTYGDEVERLAIGRGEVDTLATTAAPVADGADGPPAIEPGALASRRRRPVVLAAAAAAVIVLVIGAVLVTSRVDEESSVVDAGPKASTTSLPSTTVDDPLRGVVPQLDLEPAGPYEDRQQVTVSGIGFEPGLVLTGQIGQCPAGVDTAVDERCGYWPDTVVEVDDDGTFSMMFELRVAGPLGLDCRVAPGCVLAWVPPHRSMEAAVPLDFVS